MADIKNFGLKGVGSSVQYGKSGGTLSYDTGNSEFTFSTQVVSSALPTDNGHLANKEYVDSVAQGLNFKDSCRLATTANIDLTTVALGIIDGVQTVDGDRVLVKSQTDEIENGIYTASTGTWVRTVDADDGTELQSGTYTFIDEGAANAYSSWVVTTDNPVGIGTDQIHWAEFSRSGEATEGTGINIATGQVISTDFTAFPTLAEISGTDEVVLINNQVSTLANIIADLDIVSGVSGTGLIIKTGNDTYASRTIAASAVAGEEGLTVVNGDGVAGAPVIGLDIDALVAADLTGDTASLVPYFDGVNNVKLDLDTFLADRDMVAKVGGTGFLHEVGGVISNGAIAAASTDDLTGISVSGGDSASPTIGFSIAGLTALSDTTIADDDELFVSDVLGGVTTPQNKKITFADLKTSIFTEVDTLVKGDSSVVLTDTGADGQVEITIDGVSGAVFDSAGLDVVGTLSAGTVSVDDVASSIVSADGSGTLVATTIASSNGVSLSYNAETLSGSLAIDAMTSQSSQLSVDDLLAVYDVTGTAHVSVTVQELADIVAGNSEPDSITSNDGDTKATTVDGKSFTVAFDDADNDTLVTHLTVDGSGLTHTGDVAAATASITGHVTAGSAAITNDVSAGTATISGAATALSLGVGTNDTEFTVSAAGAVHADGAIDADGAISGLSLGVGTNDTEFTVSAAGAVHADGAIDADGAITGLSLGVGTNDTEFTVSAGGAVHADGEINALSLAIGTNDSEFTVSADGDVSAQSLSMGTTDSEFTVSAAGAVHADGAIDADGAITGLSLGIGTNDTEFTVSAAGAMSSSNAIVTDLLLGSKNGVVYADKTTGELLTSIEYHYDPAVDGGTLTVPTLVASSITGSLGQDSIVGVSTLIPYGDNVDGSLTTEADFAYTAGSNTLTVGDFDIDGGSQQIVGAALNGDISLVPNGTGNVVIGASGAGELRADTGESLTVGADGVGELKLEGNDVVLGDTAGTNKYAQFTGGSATNHLVVTSSNGSVDLDDALSTIGLSLNNGVLSILTATATDYAGDIADNDLTNKKYVDDAISAAVTPGVVATLRGTAVDLSTTTVIGSLPAGATVLSVTLNVTTIGTGDVEVDMQGTTVMSVDENDASGSGIYVASGYYVGFANDDISVIGTATSGVGDVVVEFRYN